MAKALACCAQSAMLFICCGISRSVGQLLLHDEFAAFCLLKANCRTCITSTVEASLEILFLTDKMGSA